MDLTFEQWMKAADLACMAKAGLSLLDLPDVPFRDFYEDEMAPADAADEALVEAGWED